MIELEQIKKTDPIKMLRGQLNTAFSEIQSDQPMIGKCLNPSVNLYNEGALVSSVTANNVANYLNAVILPENNGCFVLDFIGVIQFCSQATQAPVVDKIVIGIPAIKAVNASASYTSFLTPDHLGLNHQVIEDEYISLINCWYMHLVNQSSVTVPTYETHISTSKNLPGTLNIVLTFISGSVDFTNGAIGHLGF